MLFLVLALLFLGCITSNSAECHVDDLAGLLAFKAGITADPAGLLNSWKPKYDCCKWSHITCNSDNRVEHIDFFREEDKPETRLSGTLSPSLSKIHFLKSIYFRNHDFSGDNLFTILFRLPYMEFVYAGYNRLSGRIPSNVGNLTGLYALSIEGNLFSGPVPSSISKLTRLSQLALSNNMLTGTIPNGIGQLTNLYLLTLDQNRFTGKIPEMFSSITGLRELNISHNKLTGTIPKTISKMPILGTLDLGYNALTGNIPSFFGNLRNLNTLVLSSNRLSGTVPKTFVNLTDIQNLDLSYNLLVDPFPQMKSMASLDLSYNNFHLGVIPEWITFNSVVNSLKLAKCGIKISLDNWKPHYSFYQVLINIDLSDNEISGSAVNFLNQTNWLKEFTISGNQLRFDMERLRFPSRLESLDLSRNSVYGKLPKEISGLKKLNVSYNHLCGLIPPTNFSSASFVGNDCLCDSPLPPCKK